MEFSFEYYDWLRAITKEPAVLIFVSLLGSFAVLMVLAAICSFLKAIGLRVIAESSFVTDFLAVLGITGVLGTFFIMLLVIPASMFNFGSENHILGIRIVLIWITAFIFLFVFYRTNKVALKKWYNDMESKMTPKAGKKTKNSKKK